MKRIFGLFRFFVLFVLVFVLAPAVWAQETRRPIASVQKFSFPIDLTMGKMEQLVIAASGRGDVVGMLGFFSREADKGLWAVSVSDIAGTDITGSGCSGCYNYPFRLGAGDTLALKITAASPVETGMMTIGAFGGGISVRAFSIQEAKMTAPQAGSFGFVGDWKPDTGILLCNPDPLHPAFVVVQLSDPYGVVVAAGDVKLEPGEVAKFMLRELLTRLPAGELPHNLVFHSATPVIVNF
jgi:hypothetical protein